MSRSLDHIHTVLLGADSRISYPLPTLQIFLRNKLKYALTGREVTLIVAQRLVKVDGKVRTDNTYPAGFMGECASRSTVASDVACASEELPSSMQRRPVSF